MENYMDYYFEEIFNNLDRDSLNEKNKRRELVEYFCTVIAGCAKGQNLSDNTTCKNFVVSALRYHNNCKVKNGDVCLMGKYHNLLYIAMKLAFDWSLQDNGVVAALLDELYACEKTFERIFLAAVVIAFFVCWVPFHIQRLFYIYGHRLPQFHAINEHLFNVAGALYYVSATVNPILYNVMSERYRKAFQETLLCRAVGRRDSRTCELTTCRDLLPSTISARHRDSRQSFVRIDYIKDPPPVRVGLEESEFKTFSIT